MAATRKESGHGRKEELRCPRRHFDRARERVVLRGEVLRLRGWEVGGEEEAIDSSGVSEGARFPLWGWETGLAVGIQVRVDWSVPSWKQFKNMPIKRGGPIKVTAPM